MPIVTRMSKIKTLSVVVADKAYDSEEKIFIYILYIYLYIILTVKYNLISKLINITYFQHYKK